MEQLIKVIMPYRKDEEGLLPNSFIIIMEQLN